MSEQRRQTYEKRVETAKGRQDHDVPHSRQLQRKNMAAIVSVLLFPFYSVIRNFIGSLGYERNKILSLLAAASFPISIHTPIEN